MRDLVLLVGAVVAFFAFVKGMGRALHWYAHKSESRIGQQVIWRRPSDKVMMVGWRCHICGKLTCVQPERGSYKRMMRGQKFT